MSTLPRVYSPEDLALGTDVRMFAVVFEGPRDTGKRIGYPDLDPFFTTIAGPESVAQELALRFYCERGVLRDAPDTGMMLIDAANMALRSRSLGALKAQVTGEAAQVERIQSFTVTITPDYAAQSLAIEISGECDTGPFALVLGVQDLTLSVLRASP